MAGTDPAPGAIADAIEAQTDTYFWPLQWDNGPGHSATESHVLPWSSDYFTGCATASRQSDRALVAGRDG